MHPVHANGQETGIDFSTGAGSNIPLSMEGLDLRFHFIATIVTTNVGKSMSGI